MTRTVTDLDWSTMVFDLKRAGMAQHQICRALGGRITEAALRQYMAGTTAPSHWRGEMLLALWVEKTGRARADAPTRLAPITHAAARRGRRFPNQSAQAFEAMCAAFRLPPAALLRAIEQARRGRARVPVGVNLELPGMELHD